MSQTHHLSLPLLQQRLRQEFKGQGPSIATLKRWAASGFLDTAKQHEHGKDGKKHRVKFDFALAKRLILTRWHPRQAAENQYVVGTAADSLNSIASPLHPATAHSFKMTMPRQSRHRS